MQTNFIKTLKVNLSMYEITNYFIEKAFYWNFALVGFVSRKHQTEI